MGDSNYIGSKLSLISKSDIRYVGILQNVDTQSSTLVLGQVQSFGTEGRRGGSLQHEIPPSYTIFEYIVFRGADVKDLQVFEAPPVPLTFSTTIDGFTQYPPPPLTCFYNNNNNNNNHYSIPYGLPVTYYPTFPLYSSSPDTNLATRYMITQKPQVPDDVLSKSEILVPDSSMELNTTTIGDGDKHLMISKPDTKDSPIITSSRIIPEPLNTVSNTTEVDRLTNLVDDLNIGHMKDQSPIDEGESLGKTMATINNKKKTTSKDKSGNQINNNKSRKSNYKSKKPMSSSSSSSLLTKESTLQDFDFASSNAKFNKEIEGMGLDSMDAFYDKKSFFDNISCDAKERTESIVTSRNYRKKQMDEKQLNLETFGQASIHQGRKQSRRGGRTNSKRHNNPKQRRGGGSDKEHLVIGF